MSADFKQRILREQVRLAMEQLPTMQGASLIVALVLCYTIRYTVPYENILVWGALVLFVSLLRVALYQRFSKVRNGSFFCRAVGERLSHSDLDFGHILGALVYLNP